MSGPVLSVGYNSGWASEGGIQRMDAQLLGPRYTPRPAAAAKEAPLVASAGCLGLQMWPQGDTGLTHELQCRQTALHSSRAQGAHRQTS